jgi:hypothetical protein
MDNSALWCTKATVVKPFHCNRNRHKWSFDVKAQQMLQTIRREVTLVGQTAQEERKKVAGITHGEK